MLPSNSLKTTLLWSMISVALFSVCMVGTLTLYQEYRKFNSELTTLRTDYIATQKTEIKEEVDRVIDYIEFKRTSTENSLKNNIKSRVEEAVSQAQAIYNIYHNKKSKEEVKELIRETLRPVRFNSSRGYFFIYDLKGDNILLPFSPHLEGTNLLHLQDSKGGYTIQRAIDIVKNQGNGFLRWFWYKPGNTKKMSEKIGYVKYFEPYDWWIGTGEYIEDFEKDIQKETLARINRIRFGKDGYVFAFDYNAVTLAHYNQQFLGVSRWDFKDANGIYVLRELIKICQQKDGGFLEYVGTIRPSTGLPAPKIGYSRSVDDWQWMVGAGVYVDTINEVLAKKRENLVAKTQKTLLTVCAILALSILFIGFFTKYVIQKISYNIKVFTKFFNKAEQDSVKIEPHHVHFSEFKSLAKSANTMVDERERASASLNQLQEQLIRSRKMEALGVLAGGVAHDLNNVLSAVVGYPDLILSKLPPDSPHRKHIMSIKESGQKMASIVQDLLTLGRRGIAQEVILNINSLVEQYLNSPEHKALSEEYPDVQVNNHLDPNLLSISGSHAHLQTTILNLVSNAAEAQPNGGSITLTTKNRYIESQDEEHPGRSEGEYVVLSVADEGTGINSDDMEHIFEPFFSKKHPGKTSGSGLGMAVVWGTVQDHHGFINVSTASDKGTTFDLFFPAVRSETTQILPQETINNIQGDGETVLVVDDLKEQRKLSTDILELLGYKAVTATSGEEALEWLKNNKADILVLDMIMEPGIDGLETFKRALTIYPNQKAIIASGYSETDRVKAAISLGVGQYVRKPYTIDVLAKAIKQELQQGHR